MSYQALARKWRPRRFEDMVGQEHVVRALANALDNDRVHHAFLFSGTRGVGKTSLARIFAKALNCETGVSSTPCGECGICVALDQGRFVDLIEVDAASRTRVEDTRDLMDNVQYAPTLGRYKVYLIDEVHMLTGHSFNALLKTLEEPPAHVKFLLATTDPQKLPVTVLSRCLQFHLKALAPASIAEQLDRILVAEEVASEQAATRLLARAANGSLRDALSLLDQAIAHGAGGVKEASVRDMLGTLDRTHVVRFLECLVDTDGAGLLAVVDEVAEQALDWGAALEEIMLLLHEVSLAQIAPDALAARDGDDAPAKALAERLSPEDVQLYYQIGLIGRRDLPLAPDPRTGFEMVLLRMLAFRPDAAIASGETGAGGGSAGASRAHSPRPAASRRQPTATRPSGMSADSPEENAPRSRAVPSGEAPAAEGGAVEFDADSWLERVRALRLGGLARELAMHVVPQPREPGGPLRLYLDPAHGALLTDARRRQLVDAVRDAFGADLRVDIVLDRAEGESAADARERLARERLADAERTLEKDPGARMLSERFGATLVPGSVEPLE